MTTSAQRAGIYSGNAAEDERRARREEREARETETQAAIENNRKAAGMQRKTKHGTVQLPPKIDPVLREADDAIQELREAIKDIVEGAKQDAALDDVRPARPGLRGA